MLCLCVLLPKFLVRLFIALRHLTHVSHFYAILLTEGESHLLSDCFTHSSNSAKAIYFHLGHQHGSFSLFLVSNKLSSLFIPEPILMLNKQAKSHCFNYISTPVHVHHQNSYPIYHAIQYWEPQATLIC